MGCTHSKHDIENDANDSADGVLVPHAHNDKGHKGNGKHRHAKNGKKHSKHHAHASRSPQKTRASFTGTHSNPMDARTNSGASTANTNTHTSTATKTESPPLSPSPSPPPSLSPAPSVPVIVPVPFPVSAPPSLISPSALLSVSSPVNNNAHSPVPPSPTGPVTAPLTPHNSLPHNSTSQTQTNTLAHTNAHAQEDNRSVDERSDRSAPSGPALTVSQHEQFRRKHFDELSKSTRSKNNILSVRGGRGGVRRPSAGSREASVSLSSSVAMGVNGSHVLSLGSASYDSHTDALPSSLTHSDKGETPHTHTESSSRNTQSAHTRESAQVVERALSRPPLDTHSLTHSRNTSSQSIDALADAHTPTLTDTETATATTTTTTPSPATGEKGPNESETVSVPVPVSVFVPVPASVCESPKQKPRTPPSHTSESALCDVLSPNVTLREKQRESIRLAHSHAQHNAPTHSEPNEIAVRHSSLNTLTQPLPQLVEECESAGCVSELEKQTVSVCVETVSVRETLTDTELSHTTTRTTTTTETVRVLHTHAQSPPRSRTHSHADMNTPRSRTQSHTDESSPRSPPRETLTESEGDAHTQAESEAAPMKLFSKDMITPTSRTRTAEQAQHEADKLRHFQRLGSATVVSNVSTPNRDISRSLSSTLLGRPHPGRGGRGFTHSHSVHVPHTQRETPLSVSVPSHNAPTQSLFSRSLPASPASNPHSLSHKQPLPLSLSDDTADHTTRPLSTLVLPHKARAAHNAPLQDAVEEALAKPVGIAQRDEIICEAECEVESEGEGDEKKTNAPSAPAQETAAPVVPLATQPAPTMSSLLHAPAAHTQNVLAQPRSVVAQQINAQHSQSFHNLTHAHTHAESEASGNALSERAESNVGESERPTSVSLSAVGEGDKASERERQSARETESESEDARRFTFADVYAPRGRERSRPSSRKSISLSSAAVKQKEKEKEIVSPTLQVQTQAESSESVLQPLSLSVSASDSEDVKDSCSNIVQPAETVLLSHSSEPSFPLAAEPETAQPTHTNADIPEPPLTAVSVVSEVIQTGVETITEPVVTTTDTTQKPPTISEAETAQPAKDVPEAAQPAKDATEAAQPTRTAANTSQSADTTTGRPTMRAFWAAKEKERERERDRRAPLSPTASMNAASMSAVSLNTQSTLSVSERETNVVVSSTSVSESVSQRETQRETVSEERVVIETESTAQNARRFFLQQQMQQQKSSSRPGSDNFNKSLSGRGRGNAVRLLSND